MNRIHLLTSIVALAGFMSGCHHELRPPSDLTIILPNNAKIYRQEDREPDRLGWQGASVPTDFVSRNGGFSKAYPMGRTEDAAGGAMHEAHVMYRMESAPRWLLDAPGEKRIYIGPTLGDKPAALQPAVIEEELAAQNAKRDSATQSLVAATEKMLGKVKDLEAAKRNTDDRLEQNEAVIKKLVFDGRSKDAVIRTLREENAKLKDSPNTGYQGDK